jgi:putative transcriptional regulator
MLDKKHCMRDIICDREKLYFREMKNRLKVIRAERNWSQAELAEKLGVSRQTINAIETERYDPSLPLAFKIARLVNLKIEDIFQLDEDGGKGMKKAP